MPRYIVRLTETERQQLEQMLAKGRHAASTAARARILLKADESKEGPGWTDGDIVRALDTSLSTAHRVRQEFVELGLEAALYRRKPTGRQYRKLDGVQAAILIMAPLPSFRHGCRNPVPRTVTCRLRKCLKKA